MRMTRFPSLTETQFLGCTAAFVDSLFGELNSAASVLRRLEGQSKGSGFAYEMSLDSHRYGALIVLDRWATLAGTFGPHVQLSRGQSIIENAPMRVRSAEGILAAANQLLDGAETYNPDVVEACVIAFQALSTTFKEERTTTEQVQQLGPMLPEDYHEARRVFLEDLAAR